MDKVEDDDNENLSSSNIEGSKFQHTKKKSRRELREEF